MFRIGQICKAVCTSMVVKDVLLFLRMGGMKHLMIEWPV